MRFVVPILDEPGDWPKAVRRQVAQRQEAVRQAHIEHKARLRPLLSGKMTRLLDWDLHDATIRKLVIDTVRNEMTLCFRGLDYRHGEFDMRARYRETRLTRQVISLLCLIAYEDSAEVYWTELDRDATGDSTGNSPFVQRILWNIYVPLSRPPRGEGLWMQDALRPELEFRFGSAEVTVTQKSPLPKMLPRERRISVIRDRAAVPGTDGYPYDLSGALSPD